MGAGFGANRQTHAEIALMSLMSITFLLIHARTTYMQTSRLCQNRGKTICGPLSLVRARGSRGATSAPHRSFSVHHLDRLSAFD
jgi:hypothetical protein